MNDEICSRLKSFSDVCHDYQKVAIDKICSCPNTALLLDCGLGKTIITLMAIVRLKLNKVLIVAPPTVVETVWEAEARSWEETKHLRFSYLTGNAKRRIKNLEKDADIYLISNANAAWLRQQKIEGKMLEDFQLIVLDESTAFKNISSARTKAFLNVKNPRKVILTATPMSTGLMDLYSQYKILDGGKSLGTSLERYQNEFFYNASLSFENWQPQIDAEERIFSRINPITLSMKSKDLLSLPKKIEVVNNVTLDEQELKSYEKLEEEMTLTYVEEQLELARQEYERSDKTKTIKFFHGKLLNQNIRLLTNKLRQFANGFVITKDKEVIYIHDKKIQVLRNILLSAMDENILIAYHFDEDRKRIEALCEELELTFGNLKDSKNICLFKEGKLKVGLLHPLSCGFGLNLQKNCHRLIWYTLPWSYSDYEQTIARVYRQGQQETTMIHTIICKGTKDEDVLDVIRKRGQVNENLKDASLAYIVKKGYADEKDIIFNSLPKLNITFDYLKSLCSLKMKERNI